MFFVEELPQEFGHELVPKVRVHARPTPMTPPPPLARSGMPADDTRSFNIWSCRIWCLGFC